MEMAMMMVVEVVMVMVMVMVKLQLKMVMVKLKMVMVKMVMVMMVMVLMMMMVMVMVMVGDCIVEECLVPDAMIAVSNARSQISFLHKDLSVIHLEVHLRGVELKPRFVSGASGL